MQYKRHSTCIVTKGSYLITTFTKLGFASLGKHFLFSLQTNSDILSSLEIVSLAHVFKMECVENVLKLYEE